MARLQQHYREKVVPELTAKFGYKSPMQVPRLTKITLNMGVSEAVADKKVMDNAVGDLTKIAGQKPVVTKAKKAIAGFKIREQQAIGCMVTLRGVQMYEFLLFAITDGERYVCLAGAQDHKRASDGDRGKNTGGMGAYAPAPVLTSEVLATVRTRIVEPTIRGMAAEGRPYRGCLYVGLMMTASGPNVVEYNCRFGDPETQVVVPLYTGDFFDLLWNAARGSLDPSSVPPPGRGTAVCVVLASGGYPGEYEKGRAISGLDAAETLPGVHVFHAGTEARGLSARKVSGCAAPSTCFSKETELQAVREMILADDEAGRRRA